MAKACPRCGSTNFKQTGYPREITGQANPRMYAGLICIRCGYSAITFPNFDRASLEALQKQSPQKVTKKIRKDEAQRQEHIQQNSSPMGKILVRIILLLMIGIFLYVLAQGFRG